MAPRRATRLNEHAALGKPAKPSDYKEVPPRVDYALTPLGLSLSEAIVPLCTWGNEHMAEMASIFANREANAGEQND